MQHFVLNTSRKCLSLAPQAKPCGAFGWLLSADALDLVIGADVRYIADVNADNLSYLLISDSLMLMSMLITFLNRVGSTTLLLMSTLVANDKLVLLLLIRLMLCSFLENENKQELINIELPLVCKNVLQETLHMQLKDCFSTSPKQVNQA